MLLRSLATRTLLCSARLLSPPSMLARIASCAPAINVHVADMTTLVGRPLRSTYKQHDVSVCKLYTRASSVDALLELPKEEFRMPKPRPDEGESKYDKNVQALSLIHI